MINNCIANFVLDGFGNVEISVPRELSVNEVIGCALSSKQGIPCITEDGNRALISCDGHFKNPNPPFKVINTTKERLIEAIK